MNTIKACLGALAFAASSAAFAIPIAVTGGADTLVAWGNVHASDAAQANFIAGYLGVDSDELIFTKIDEASGEGAGSPWQQVDEDSSLWALDFASFAAYEPAVFLIRTGAHVTLDGSSSTYNTFLFDNSLSARYGVIDLDIFGRNRGNVEIGMVSHASVAVPEPGMLSLLGAGLLAAGFFGRRRRKALTA